VPRIGVVAVRTGVATNAKAVTPAVLPRGEVRAVGRARLWCRFGGSANRCAGLGCEGGKGVLDIPVLDKVSTLSPIKKIQPCHS
jgi:hypothetical protein